MKKVCIKCLFMTVVVSQCAVIMSCTDDDKDETKVENNSTTVTVKDGTTVNFVDLGLPSGTLWADRNVGAKNLGDYGGYYAWGEISEKAIYALETYLGGVFSKDGGWETIMGTSMDPMRKILDFAGDARYDAATANWGDGYKTPTEAQCKELVNNTVWEWCDGEYVKYENLTTKGFKVTSKKNGNSIFLPAAGWKSDYYNGVDYSFGHRFIGMECNYYSSTRCESDNTGEDDYNAVSIYCSADKEEAIVEEIDGPDCGESVRPVMK